MYFMFEAAPATDEITAIDCSADQIDESRDCTTGEAEGELPEQWI